MTAERNKKVSEKLQTDRDSQINVVVNSQGEDDMIELTSVFRNMKALCPLYVWIILLLAVLGVSLPLLLYQFTKPNTRVASVVTLDYDVVYEPDLSVTPTVSVIPTPEPVRDLTAPDGTELDLSQITSSYVLQNALSGLVLSKEISITQLRDNIRVERILTEDSRRQQEVASKMLADKNSGAYAQLQSVELTYVNQFVVSLENGFGSEEDGKKIYLEDDELCSLLDRVLNSYNDYLAMNYADFKLPGDEISVIDTEGLDIMESLDLLRSAMDNLYRYCDEQTDEVKAYRSWRDGRSLSDLMQTLETAREVNVEYLYSHVYANSIAKNRSEMLSKYRYQLREAQTKLDVANENIATTEEILKNYKHDQIFVENQESDSSKSTRITTDYYNKLILQQAQNYDDKASLEITIDDLKAKIENLQADSQVTDTEKAKVELAKAMEVCSEVYNSICEQMEEVMAAPFYTTFADSSAAQGKSVGFLSACMKKMVLGAILGVFLGCCLWFVSAFAAEIRRAGRKTSDKEVAR